MLRYSVGLSSGGVSRCLSLFALSIVNPHFAVMSRFEACKSNLAAFSNFLSKSATSNYTEQLRYYKQKPLEAEVFYSLGGSRQHVMIPPREFPNFNNSIEAYKHASLFELLKSIIILQACQFKLITLNIFPMLNGLSKIFGNYLVYDCFLRFTIFTQFCGGRNEEEVRHSLRKLQKLHVGSVLDYAAEAPDANSSSKSAYLEPTPQTVSMETMLKTDKIFYAEDKEHIFDANMKLYLLCVAHASISSGETKSLGHAAVKLTGLCDPRILARINAMALKVRQMWAVLYNRKCPIEECRSILDIKCPPEEYAVSVKKLKQELHRMCAATGWAPVGKIPGEVPSFTNEELDLIIKELDPQNTGTVKYFRFTEIVTECILNERGHPGLSSLCAYLPTLTEKEVFIYSELYRRINTIVRVATELNVRVMIDAEQSFYQIAIDHITRNLQRMHNNKLPIVYNTYQTYLTIAQNRLKHDFGRAKDDGWVWGGKIVRGAYMNQERKVAIKLGYKSPIWPDIQSTHKCYNECAMMVIDEMEKNPEVPMSVLFGTHNQKSIELISERILKLKTKSSIGFGQLLGMGDYLTMPLSNAGFEVVKYVPYGPVKETILYLARRAEENADMLRSGSTELSQLRSAFKHRLFFFGSKSDKKVASGH